MTFQTRSSARCGSFATSRPIISCMPSPAMISSTVLSDMPKTKSPNCSSPRWRATTTKKTSDATFPTASPPDRANVPKAIRRDARTGLLSRVIASATLASGRRP
jgi:hypothetical protein